MGRPFRLAVVCVCGWLASHGLLAGSALGADVVEKMWEPPLPPRPVKFRHEVIDPSPPGWELDIVLFADLNERDGWDIIIGSKKGEANLWWYENPTWKRHVIAKSPELEAGGVMFDVNRDGRLDIVAGQQWGGRELYWFECPKDPRQPWTRHLIENRFEKYHDQAVGDVDVDGKMELLISSQNSRVLAYYDIPDDPTVSPWPKECCHVIAEGLKEELEGLLIYDIDGDKKNEVIAGPNVFRPAGEGKPWERHCFAPGYQQTRVEVGYLDVDDSRPCLVICEGESDAGRLAVCRPPKWEPEVLRADLFHPHSLAIADFDGNGTPDIFVGEMGLGRHKDPKMIVFLNTGRGKFEEQIIQRGIPTHEAKAVDLNFDGRPDIVGKPYEDLPSDPNAPRPKQQIDIWWNETGK